MHLISLEDSEKPSTEVLTGSINLDSLSFNPSQIAVHTQLIEGKDQQPEEINNAVSHDTKKVIHLSAMDELKDFIQLFVSQKLKPSKEIRGEDGINSFKLSPLHLYISRQNRNGGNGSI